MDKIAIIGMGLIGGSIGLALNRANRGTLEVVGFDTEPKAAKRAVKLGAVSKATRHLNEAVGGANMVIIATPVLAIRETLEAIAGMLSPGCVVTDTGSTKEAIMTWAEEYLPKEVSFVGGHPMAGKETSGIDAADADLFKDARYVVIPGRTASQEAIEAVLNLVQLLGARNFFLDAFEHDSYVAAVSHLPIVLSAALVTAAAKSPSWREISKLASTGFRDATRLASGDPIMNLDICLTNRDGILYWIDETVRELLEYKKQIAAATTESGDEEAIDKLADTFANSWEIRERWLAHYESGRDDDGDSSRPETPGAGDLMGEMLMGRAIRDRYKKMSSLFERQQEDPRRRRLRRS
ncbi:MAG: prephenate dehydrogenase/arogenate dehydrogenase family protein [Chloroflexi bacterium]|nr:prephenate dehydrogenase/arogenate dehydrogenase family protein [Chloroflexota bacterium]